MKTFNVCVRVTFWENYEVEAEDEEKANDIALSMASDDFNNNPRRYPEDIRVEE